MNDLDQVRDLMPDAPVPSPGELTSARGRLTAAIQATIDTERNGDAPAGTTHGTWPLRHGRAGRRHKPGRAWGRLPVRARRLAFGAVATAAVAAAGATVLTAVPGYGRQAARPAVAAPSTHPASTMPATQQAPGTINVAAATFLNHAAAVLQRQLAQPPGPDQYIYTENNEGRGRVERAWVSTDGNQPGLDTIWQGSRLIYDKQRPPCTIAQAELSNQTNGAKAGDCGVGEAYGPGYFPDMPTNPQGLSAYLAEIGVDPTGAEAAGMGSGWLANSLGKAVEEVMPYIYLTPAQQAAWYELLAQTPGFTLVRSVRDVAGRTGVGIAWSYLGGAATILIFNPVTFAFMGVTGTGSDSQNGATALVQMAFVNEIAQLP
jgi:hypothetical protein